MGLFIAVASLKKKEEEREKSGSSHLAGLFAKTNWHRRAIVYRWEGLVLVGGSMLCSDVKSRVVCADWVFDVTSGTG